MKRSTRMRIKYYRSSLVESGLAAHRTAPPAELRSRQRPRDPAGRCYELAGKYFLDHGDTEGVRLVHGFVSGRLVEQFAHAWVELPGDLVYDRGAFFIGAGYRDVQKPEPIKTWNSRRAFAQAVETDFDGGNYFGPCKALQAEKDRRRAP